MTRLDSAAWRGSVSRRAAGWRSRKAVAGPWRPPSPWGRAAGAQPDPRPYRHQGTGTTPASDVQPTEELNVKLLVKIFL